MVPKGLKYTREHEWVRVEGDAATIGITDYAQSALGDITYVEVPEVGTELKSGKEFAVVESAKAASDVFAPVDGTVTEVNSALAESPELINQGPYGEGWLCRVKGVPAEQLDSLLSPKEYEQLIAEEETSKQ